MKQEDKSLDLFQKKIKVLFELTNLESAKSLKEGFNKKSNILLMYKELVKEQIQ